MSLKLFYNKGWEAFYEGHSRAVQLGDQDANNAWYKGYDAAADTEYKRIAAQEFSDLSTWLDEE
jgi:hypothetical protein